MEQNKLENEPATNKFIRFWKANRKVIFLISIVIVVVLTYYYSTRQRWMVWEGDHYEEVSFDREKFQDGELKLYKKDRIDNFRKIDPSCNYEFFNTDKSVRVWYGKNSDKDYEYFTALGLHPNTGKSLKPITSYIIDKYICN